MSLREIEDFSAEPDVLLSQLLGEQLGYINGRNSISTSYVEYQTANAVKARDGLIDAHANMHEVRRRPLVYWEELAQTNYEQARDEWRARQETHGPQLKTLRSVLIATTDQIPKLPEGVSPRVLEDLEYQREQRLKAIDEFLAEPVKADPRKLRRHHLRDAIARYLLLKKEAEGPDMGTKAAYDEWCRELGEVYRQALEAALPENEPTSYTIEEPDFVLGTS
jgi:hypothetical protein